MYLVTTSLLYSRYNFFWNTFFCVLKIPAILHSEFSYNCNQNKWFCWLQSCGKRTFTSFFNRYLLLLLVTETFSYSQKRKYQAILPFITAHTPSTKEGNTDEDRGQCLGEGKKNTKNLLSQPIKTTWKFTRLTRENIKNKSIKPCISYIHVTARLFF